MKASPDQSLLAWKSGFRQDEDEAETRPLARSPIGFLNCSSIVSMPADTASFADNKVEPFEMINMGLRIELRVAHIADTQIMFAL